jgi:hypothetical protein
MVNSEICHIDTSKHSNFHQLPMNLTIYLKVFNMLPSFIKIETDNPKKFKLIFHKCLYKTSFYALDEYFELKKN